MSVTSLTTSSEFDDFIKSKSLLAIHFYAPWAEQCTQINQLLDMLVKSSEYKDVRFAKVEAEELADLSLKHGVTAVPTVILMRDSVVIDRVDGVNPAILVEKIKQYISPKNSTSIESTKSEANLEDRLKQLINQAPCMLFMKGDRETPRCGFSRTIVGILDSLNADYQTFDILQDNTVREGLKKFSNWPTYPQLYVNGELLGGLDIVKEMNESGELELPKKSNVETKS
ncbi:hypothetical protein PV325_012543 [Microctonus aethiopoides]|uniref:Thioredoxin domain-containing protein n=1 Tax=Microctonus aethiopoides TaxID=144406 RepID=A0AA39F8H9_9HYME|nr:hypothetical protein PV325_012543 [Microctonus aethiopoides]KAK0098367.1 hypothetical protein PV326_009120 [Microctonus aethiopoides]KAK0164924.1 hypothetical protein PV328_003490 [Microctonus aethiopoides]